MNRAQRRRHLVVWLAMGLLALAVLAAAVALRSRAPAQIDSHPPAASTARPDAGEGTP